MTEWLSLSRLFCDRSEGVNAIMAEERTWVVFGDGHALFDWVLGGRCMEIVADGIRGSSSDKKKAKK